MEFKEVIGRRRSIRYYQPWRRVEREKVQTILEAARLASASVNVSYAKALIVLRDDLTMEQRNSLKTPTLGVQLDTAPVYIFWFADLDAAPRAVREGAPGLKKLIEVGALNPSHGWSLKYVENVVIPQVLKPLTADPTLNSFMAWVETALAMCQALLCTVDEDLGTQLVNPNRDAVNKLFKVPSTWSCVWLQTVGYPAEGWEAGGQRPRGPWDEDFFEWKGGKMVPFKRDEKVVERLKDAKMVQDPAPLPWRKEEVRHLSRMFGLPE